MSRWFRIAVTLSVLVLGTVTAGAAYAASAQIEQVRNGTASATTTPVPSWGTGNAGGSNSHYLESHSIAYRTVMDQLPTDGTVVELIIGYDVKRSGSYALDYLTQYQRLLPHVLFGHRDPEVFDPLSGVTGVTPGTSTAPIPTPTVNLTVDPDGAESEPAASQPSTSMNSLPAAERVMTLFGGTLVDVTYVTQADVSLATRSSETQVRVRFIPAGPKAVLAWGGHIASRWEWGFNADGTPRSAGGISGSSYHMRLISWNLGSLGSQDRSMSTDAVYPVPRCGVSNAGPFCAGSTNTHTAPAGMESYAWSLVDNTSGAVIVGSSTGPSVSVQSTTAGSYTLVVTTGASGFTKECQSTVTVNAAPVADAGPDQVVCATGAQVQLAGVATGGTGAWTGGAGSFNPGRSAANAVYTPSAAEITAGTVTLTLTASPVSGPCPPSSDAMRITIQRAATANAGADLTVCASSPQATLAGIVGGAASGGTWSGGAGSFSPSASALNATYTPTTAEIAAGGVTLTLTTNDPNGPCGAVSDQVRITVNPAATVNAGADLTVCASSPQAQLAGTVGGGGATGTWSGGAGTFSPRSTALNATYTPTAAEIAAGGVTLTLTTNDPAGVCPAVSDQVRITIDPATVVSAGPDQTVCSTSPQTQLFGTVGGTVSSGTWSGGTGTFNPGRSALNAVYTPSAAEIAARTVTLTLNSAASAGPCPPASDAMIITINPAVTVNAGPDQVVCAASPQAVLAGVLGNGATGGTWSGGTGTFQPNATTLNATYVPSAAEIAAGSVTLTLTSNDPAGPCPAVSDAMQLTIDAPTVTVANRTVCTGIAPVTMCATPGRGIAPFTYVWSTGATTQCISVSDTITYTVTMTDARGCQATASGTFKQRECVGQIAHTSTTCETFMDGTSWEMVSSDVNWVLRDGVISSISPGVLFYFTKITAPRPDFTVQILQTKDNPDFPFIEVQQAQVTLSDANCAQAGSGVVTGLGQASVDVLGATTGQVFIVYAKYSLKSLVGTPMDDSTGCHYDFKTVIDGVVVDQDPEGLQIGFASTPPPPPPPPPAGGIDGGGGSDDADIINPPIRDRATLKGSESLEPQLAALYRPAPNPFTGDMRMAYAVGGAGERVRISVYDLAGRLVRTLTDDFQSPGQHTVVWDGRDAQGTRMRQGVFFVHAQIGAQARQVRVTFVK